jgi:hypothetical protein
MQIINKVTGQIIDNGLDERNAGILIDEYQDDEHDPIYTTESRSHTQYRW